MVVVIALISQSQCWEMSPRATNVPCFLFLISPYAVCCMSLFDPCGPTILPAAGLINGRRDCHCGDRRCSSSSRCWVLLRLFLLDTRHSRGVWREVIQDLSVRQTLRVTHQPWTKARTCNGLCKLHYHRKQSCADLYEGRRDRISLRFWESVTMSTDSCESSLSAIVEICNKSTLLPSTLIVFEIEPGSRTVFDIYLNSLDLWGLDDWWLRRLNNAVNLNRLTIRKLDQCHCGARGCGMALGHGNLKIYRCGGYRFSHHKPFCKAFCHSVIHLVPVPMWRSVLGWSVGSQPQSQQCLPAEPLLPPSS